MYTHAKVNCFKLNCFYVYKRDLALNNLQWLISHKNQTKPITEVLQFINVCHYTMWAPPNPIFGKYLPSSWVFFVFDFCNIENFSEGTSNSVMISKHE